MANLKLKSKLQAQQGISLPQETSERALVVDSSGDIKSSSVTQTELEHLSGVTSSVQDQLDDILEAAEDAQQAIDDHIADTTGAHAASAISVVPAGNLAADDVQEALEELQQDIDSRALDSDVIKKDGSVAFTDDQSMGDNKITDLADPTADQDAATKKYVDDEIAALPEPLFYAGVYDADTNTPDLDLAGARVSGAVYKVTVAGTHDFDTFGGEITFQLGDKAVFNGILDVWEKWDVTDNENTDQITEGSTNLFFTDERAQDAVGNILVDSDTVNLVYDDGDDEISAEVKVQQSITSDSSGIKLDGDATTPGNDKYYGTDDSGVKGFHDLPTGGSENDIQETSFSITNDVDTATSITGFLLDSQVRSFKALVSVEIDATLERFESFELLGVQKNGVFEMAQQSVGDESGVVLSITSGGQVQYTSADYAGFVAGVIRFRAITTSF